MEEDHNIDISRRKFSSRLIIARAQSRKWKVTGFKTNPSLLLLQPPGRSKPIKIFSAAPMQTSHPAAMFADDKYITSQLLNHNGIPVLPELLVDETTPTEAIDDFIKAQGTIVVKPLDSGHGNGITMGLQDRAAVESAVSRAQAFTETGMVLLQKELAGHDIRVVCINYRAVDAISRIPAGVTGDGTHTTEELILAENQSEDRGQNYSAKLNIIDMEKAREYLGAAGLSAIPKSGEKVQVIGMSNVGLGGTIKNGVLAELPAHMIEAAEKVARIMDLAVCGVDFLVEQWPHPNDTPEDNDYRVIEVNKCPMLTMYPDTTSEAQNKVIDAYLDLLESTPETIDINT